MDQPLMQNRQCPLKNHPENVDSAQMFATALTKGTLAIRTQKYDFRKSFFISIFLMPDERKCRRDQNFTRYQIL